MHTDPSIVTASHATTSRATASHATTGEPAHSHAPRLNRRRLLKLALVALPCLLLASLLGLWLALHRIPAWYRPAVVEEAVLPGVRADAARLVDSISDQMVRGRRFTLELRQEEMNELMSSMGRIWPDALKDWPPALQQPALSFDADGLRVGVTLMRSEDRAVISAALSVSVAEDRSTLHAQLISVHAGALPVPAFLIDSAAQPYLGRMGDASDRSRRLRSWGLQGADAPSARALMDQGVRLPNRFTWPNGEREFRILSMEFHPGVARIEIEPL
ncbi:MAG: hypothetical protein IT449_10315 [Phycisphaerales bacterium]|nr:hypothetical protein [Phycisphaerales bacterium]